ncbi:indolepyruvate ferredoxin oxidoreductase [Amylibacter marinus]|uniref:Indolepyruvate ferredoxin oxidoreductase n=1 Tax=Amylibacter marinus TaxID=1475483 RepID=A0ABQ5VYG8_9RHOB|nr:indolepyruvate ferredoxin oxidoreductase family protein [Amylibacter marinus]GLQ36292.1 indolepyruvate ferredoxin oxidoreductase [Amylibacter marinus]
MNKPISLDDKYTASSGRVLMTGTQALVRLPMAQMRRDRAAGHNTGAFISGYRGSPMGAYDQQLMLAQRHLDKHDIAFQPGINEELAATAIWGSQQVQMSAQANKEGVVGLWYGKGPGVDRSGDVFKHANAAGTSALGGVLAFAGDDHTCKSSTVPHQSDHAFISAVMPVLYPSSVQEFIEYGLMGIAMSRYSGCWVGYKVISETIETTSVVDLAQERRQFIIPEDFEMPEGGLNMRWPDAPMVQDERLQEHKGYAAIAFARANKVNETTLDTPNARFGIVASGKSYEDVNQALMELGIDKEAQRLIGLRLFKVGMPWPLEPEGIRTFSQGLEEVLIIEERREIIEHQIKQQLFNWRADVRPRIVGKFDEADRPFLTHSKGLTVSGVARAIADRLLRLELPEGLHGHIAAKLAHLEELHALRIQHKPPVIRQPHFCAGCPHSTSTKVPEGSKAMAGIGCHYMASWIDDNTETFTQMGGEGVPWSAIEKFTDEKHRFVNLGDGTYFHSGLLAIRQSVAAKANITYKILYNDAVAMTGGQPHDGPLSPAQISHQLHHEQIKTIYLVSNDPEAHPASGLAANVIIKHRDELDSVMREVREIEGTTAIIYVQTCAAELRRRRKKGLAPDPDKRMYINPAVCEGCGDCSVQSNCIAIEPLETEFGRKRAIVQSSCNKDYSCAKGFCPSFVTVTGGQLRKSKTDATPDFSALPAPTLPSLDQPWNIAVAGVGGTGVLTIGALLAMAAHIEGKVPLVMDMAGLAQKGGAALSHIRISTQENPPTAPRIANGAADLLLAADAVVAASNDGIITSHSERTHGILNAKITPVSDFVKQRDFDFQQAAVEKTIAEVVRSKEHFHNFSHLALALMGNEIGANIMMIGYAWQKGLVPLDQASITQAVELNGVAVKANISAFNWGRMLAHDPEFVAACLPKDNSYTPLDQMGLDQLIAHRRAHLTAYQDANLAEEYGDKVAQMRQVFNDHLDTKTAERITRIAAHQLSRVMAPKDEYEVARLFSTPEFREQLDKQFTGDFKLSLNLAPPILPGKGSDGRPKKREFGPMILRVMPILSRMKFLRGTVFDPFGRSTERRNDRQMAKDYTEDLQNVMGRIAPENADQAIALLSLVSEVRGYGPVREASYATYQEKRREMRLAFAQDTHKIAAQ